MRLPVPPVQAWHMPGLFKAHRVTATARLEGDRLDVTEATQDEARWRGAELLVAAVAGGYAAELAAAAERLEIPVEALEVEASGHLTSRRDGRYGLVAVEVDATLQTEEENAGQAAVAGEVALDRCIVATALDVPLSHRVHVAGALT